MRLRWIVWLVLLVACSQKENVPYSLMIDGDKVTGIYFHELDAEDLEVYLSDSTVAVLGDIQTGNTKTLFTPVVPFQPGLAYKTNKGISFTIPPLVYKKAPEVLAVYPTCNTVPANLLKIYIAFSEPMVEGKSSMYVTLFDKTDNIKVDGAFLDLKPELWDEEGKVLTLWLDPGRIKQDLVPNKELGTVLKENHNYQLTVLNQWKSKRNIALDYEFTREFITTERDVVKPDVESWTVTTSDNYAIDIDLHESLDWSLLNSTISIWNGNKQIAVKSISEVCEKHLSLIAYKKLSKGNYELRIEARLEDLAGNNLNRLFETDITKQQTSSSQDVYVVPFTIN